MELKEFISQTLVEIVEGVQDAKDTAKHGTIMPQSRAGTAQQVHFDVAVTTTSSTTGGGKVSVMGIGGEIGGQSEHQAVSRIKFDVPIRFSHAKSSEQNN